MEVKAMTTAIFKAKEAPEVEMKEGERYAGIIAEKEDGASYHLILLPGLVKGISQEDAREWAAKQGGFLPTRREQSLLYVSLREEFEPAWYWWDEPYVDNKHAWFNRVSKESKPEVSTDLFLRARAVRRAYLGDIVV
jgi:hypothetical protein